MPRAQPTTRLDETGPLDLNPEQVPAEYIVSVLQNKNLIKPPSWNAKQDSIELYAIENSREHEASMRQQESLMQHISRQNVVNEHRIEDLFKLQDNLRKRFISVNNFIKDCDDKRTQAQHTVLEEKKIHVQLKEFIQDTKERVDGLLQFRERLLRTVKELEPYESVIHEAVGKHNIWTSVQDCTDRCDALMMTQVELVQSNNEALAKIEDIRLKFRQLSQEAALATLALNTTLGVWEREYMQVKGEVLELERCIVRIKDQINELHLTSERMADEIFRMYSTLCKRRGLEPNIKKEAVVQQMDFIREEIKILQEVARLCEQEGDKS